MSKQTIKVAVANETEKNFDIETLKSWEPKDIHYISDVVYFKNKDVYYSMKRLDFDSLYKK